jgi:hypothetical protein
LWPQQELCKEEESKREERERRERGEERRVGERRQCSPCTPFSFDSFLVQIVE